MAAPQPPRENTPLDEAYLAARRIIEARIDRDEAVRVAYRLGDSVPAIARSAGLSRGRVYQILQDS